MSNKKIMTRIEAQKYLNLSKTRIIQLLSENILTGKKVPGQFGDEWEIDTKSVHTYKDNLRKTDQDSDQVTDRVSKKKPDQVTDRVSKKKPDQVTVHVKEQHYKDILAEKDKMIDMLKKDKERLINLFEQESYRKDVILKEAVSNINQFKAVQSNIIKSVEYIQERTIEIIDSGKKRIAIIEDEEDQANILKLNLEKSGYDVFIFSNVSEAAKYYIKDAFHLTLLDLNLEKTEKISGEKFFEMLRQFQKETPVIIISGEAEERIKRAVQNTGAICYFRKPLNIDQVIKKIGKI